MAIFMNTFEPIEVTNVLVSLFMFFFSLMNSKLYEVESQIVLLFTILLFSSVYLFLDSHMLSWREILKQGKLAFILITSVLFLTPVVYTLTKATSNDTLVLFIVILIIIHVLSYNYSFVHNNNEQSSPLSFQTIVVAGILMSSRLQRLSHVFYLILFVTMYFLKFNNSKKEISDICHC